MKKKSKTERKTKRKVVKKANIKKKITRTIKKLVPSKIRKSRTRKKGFGWLPDIPDARDQPYKLKKFIKLPASVDLRPFCPPVEDQGSLGSCTANALVSALEFLILRYKEAFVDYSRLFLYYNERVYINTVDEDSGAIIRDGIKSLNRKGVCPEDMWPYDISRFTEKPVPACYSEARKHKTISYQRLNTLTQMKACLAEGVPFVFGFAVYESFYEADKGGVVPLPNLETEGILGGHAVLCVGYDNEKERFICQNSWGTSWGDKGYFYMPFIYLKSRDMSDDFWTIRF